MMLSRVRAILFVSRLQSQDCVCVCEHQSQGCVCVCVCVNSSPTSVCVCVCVYTTAQTRRGVSTGDRVVCVVVCVCCVAQRLCSGYCQHQISCPCQPRVMCLC